MMAANPAGADVCPADNELGLRWLRAFAGTKAQVAEVRRFVACLLAEHPAREALITCVSELSANAVVHTASGCGGFFTVEVSCPRSGVARVSVTDAGGPTEPAAGAPVAAEPARTTDVTIVSGTSFTRPVRSATRSGISAAGLATTGHP